MSPELLFIGPISPPLSGPGLKNKLITEELKKQYKGELTLLNTLIFHRKHNNDGKKTDFIKDLYLIFVINKIILSVSKNGRYFFIPIIYLKNLFVNGEIILLPVGGDFAAELNRMPTFLRRLYLSMLNSFDLICPETKLLEEKLKDMGLSELAVLPNPRKSVDVNRKTFNKNSINFYYISKLRKDKGIEDAIKAVNILNKKGYKCTLHVYGRGNKNYVRNFKARIKDNDYIYFHGLIENSELIPTLAEEADCLLLPTYYIGEGLPGILVEAAMARVPVVITKFKGADSYFTHRENALFVEEKNPADIAAKLEELINNEHLRNKISANLATLADEFKVEKAIKCLL